MNRSWLIGGLALVAAGLALFALTPAGRGLLWSANAAPSGLDTTRREPIGLEPASSSAPRSPKSAGAAGAEVDRSAQSELATNTPVDIQFDPVRNQLTRLDNLANRGRRTVLETPLESVADLAPAILCPDGFRLPVLNGVAQAPAIIRAPEHGTLPPVVAIAVDDFGFDWYEHADGTMTTSRPQFVTDQAGHRAVQIITVHTGAATGPTSSVGFVPTQPPIK